MSGLNLNIASWSRFPQTVTPVKAGVQEISYDLDSRLRGNDERRKLIFILWQGTGGVQFGCEAFGIGGCDQRVIDLKIKQNLAVGWAFRKEN